MQVKEPNKEDILNLINEKMKIFINTNVSIYLIL